jgi:hypothetical protein
MTSAFVWILSKRARVGGWRARQAVFKTRRPRADALPLSGAQV